MTNEQLSIFLASIRYEIESHIQPLLTKEIIEEGDILRILGSNHQIFDKHIKILIGDKLKLIEKCERLGDTINRLHKKG